MENFVLPIFAAIRRNWTKNGQKQDGIQTEKMSENGTAGQGLCPRVTAKNAGRHFL